MMPIRMMAEQAYIEKSDKKERWKRYKDSKRWWPVFSHAPPQTMLFCSLLFCVDLNKTVMMMLFFSSFCFRRLLIFLLSGASDSFLSVSYFLFFFVFFSLLIKEGWVYQNVAAVKWLWKVWIVGVILIASRANHANILVCGVVGAALKSVWDD